MKIHGRSTSLTWHSLPLEGSSIPDTMIYSIPTHRPTMTQSCRVHQCRMKVNRLNEKCTYLFPGTSQICGSPRTAEDRLRRSIIYCGVESNMNDGSLMFCHLYGISSDWIQGQAKSCMHMCEAQQMLGSQIEGCRRWWETTTWGINEEDVDNSTIENDSDGVCVSPRYNMNSSICWLLSFLTMIPLQFVVDIVGTPSVSTGPPLCLDSRLRCGL